MQDVNGKVAFVTGGASGIGLGISRALLRAGMRVAIADIRPENLDKAMQELGAGAEAVLPVRVDVTDRAGMLAAADEVERAFGKVHVLCANAGVGDIGYLKDTTYDDWDWIMSVTLGGVVNAVNALLPRIQRHGEAGHVLATSSMAGLVPVNHGGVYSVAKAAVVGMMEALRMELSGSQVGVSVVCPGMTRTNIGMTRSLRPERFRNTGYTYKPRVPPAPGGGAGPATDALNVAMDPTEVGEKVLRGIRRNDLYILPHAEFGQMLREHFEVILSAMARTAPPPGAPATTPGGPPMGMPTPYRTALGSDPTDIGGK
jgi:NAD(P)-dependent dehydrogenase (short-subunit alcohol dehydrogenase family)